MPRGFVNGFQPLGDRKKSAARFEGTDRTAGFELEKNPGSEQETQGGRRNQRRPGQMAGDYVLRFANTSNREHEILRPQTSDLDL